MIDLSFLSTPEAYISLVTLTAMEIVLGIDNIIFISILSSRLQPHERDKGRQFGLMGALLSRLLLLGTISWIVGLVKPLFAIGSFEVTGKAIILFFGGLFLIWKATKEIHAKLEGEHSEGKDSGEKVTLKSVLIQIMLLDMVFSLDSVITAVGMSQHIEIMVAANIIALAVMVVSARSISGFVERHPTVKMLALSFLIMIGLVLVADASGFHIPKGYIYFAMGFSIAVEMLNLRVHAKKLAAKTQ